MQARRMLRLAAITDPVGEVLDFVWSLRDEIQKLGLSLALFALIAATISVGVGLSNLIDAAERRHRPS